MLICIAHCQKENAQVKQLAAWMAELGPYPNHRLLVGRDERAEPNLFANSGFSSVEEITIIGDVWNHWPESCCNAFRQIAKHIEYGTKEPWLWLEADSVILDSTCFDKIEAEYQEALRHGKVFLGDFVHINEPGFIDHMSGVAVYPGVMSDHAGDALMAHDIAWDCYSAHQILPRMRKSKLILHRWKYPAFDSWEQVEKRIFQVKPDCVLFHSDKKMSLVPLLRERLSGSVESRHARSLSPEGPLPVVSTSGAFQPTDFPSDSESSASPAQPFSYDIFIKSFPGDYEWLSYCLRSIEKFATGFRRIVLVVPKPANNEYHFGTGLIHANNIRIDRIDIIESGDGYLFQQVCKLNADKYTDSEFVLFFDSDCIFTRPVTPETFMRSGKPIWLITPMEKAREDQRKAWLPVMTKWMNKMPEHEFMYRHPFMFPRWFFEKIRGFCANQHGMTLDEYIMSQPHRAFSEFNCAGFLAYEHLRDRFEWINTGTDQVPEATVLQNWSPGGLTEGIIAELERILKSATENPNIKQTANGNWVLVNDTHISRWVEEKGTLSHDGALLSILDEIPVGGTVIDVGAFIGDSTAPFLERVGPTGMVYAWEPNPDAYECLWRNLLGHGPNIKVQCCAAGETHGTAKLMLDANAGAARLTSNADTIVSVLPIDAMQLDRCDFVKLDIEGTELSALKGAEQTINRFHPKLVIEINEGALARQGSSAEEISDWLFKHGYKWRPIQPNITAASPQYDILCKWIGSQTESCSTATEPIVDWVKFERDARFTAGPNHNSREALVRDTVAILKQLCTSPVHTGKVRKELRAQGVIR